MSKPNDNELVFTLPEALSEISALRDERAAMKSILRKAQNSFGSIANELHNMDNMGQYDCRRVASEMVEVWKPVKELLK